MSAPNKLLQAMLLALGAALPPYAMAAAANATTATAGSGAGAGSGAPAATSASADAASGALAVLPPEPLVRRALESLPQLRLGTLQSRLAGVDKSRLQAGSYEWTARASVNQRRVEGGERFQEQELALERTVRWFGKAGQDQAIGAQGVVVAEAMRADAWHEAGRALMKDWFDALREQAAVARLEEQLAVTEQLRRVAAKRVRAGDSARLEQLQADTEHQRVAALALLARRRQEQALAQLEQNYVGLPAPDASRLPLPPAPVDGADYWRERILHDNHELELAEAEVALYTLRARRQSRDRMPDPTLAVRAARERAGQERLIGLTLSIPLPGAARAADRDGAALKAAMARERADQVRLRVRSAAQRAVIDSVRSHQVWQTVREVETQARRQSELMMKAYQAGECTLMEALGSRRQALDAALAAQTAQVEALAAYARVQLDAHVIWAID
ncbi:TolC family protein [Rugamonas sp. CCM 8940]|uniref:TolC family protein n=1 Tax=Rugamonas sp. CCM 8940 TaxID=2765359 RepID=UPI0018F644E0|nr:TolC family protein [Rugamonas sp. CCM 8940]MBJ7310039.1 TolC family protein [Rugamonas sp. CCM 8940]